MGSRLGAVRFAALRSGKVAMGIAATLAAVTTLAFAACQAFGGHPGGDAPPVIPDAGTLCLGACGPDPGWAAVSPQECAAARTLDKLPIVGFDDVGSTGNGIAMDMYSYTDGTIKPLLFEFTTPRTPPFASDGFQPPTLIANFCGPEEATPVPLAQNSRGAAPGGDHVLHLLGGFVPAGDHYGACNGGSCLVVPAPFRGYGGGIGVSMQKLNNRDPNNGDNNNRQYCATNTTSNPGPGTRPDVCPPMDAEYAVRIGALDVSAYEGVSFWARRGPNGQIGIHVLVGDKYTDDDLSYLSYRNDPAAPRYCERVRQCSCGNHKQCTYINNGPGQPCEFPGCGLTPPPNNALTCPTFPTSPPSPAPGGAGYYCVGPDLKFDQVAAGSITINGQGTTTFCSPLGMPITDLNTATECNLPYAAYPNDGPDGGYMSSPCTGFTSDGLSPAVAGTGGDRQFWGKPCTPYAYPNGTTAAYCFDPAVDPPPADPTQQCGDHWFTSVDLSTDWHFYKVPFTDMRQQGFAKKSEQIDLHSVSIVRFTWDSGWIDYWINDVSFYRNPK
jgi:hypothetical protein